MGNFLQAVHLHYDALKGRSDVYVTPYIVITLINLGRVLQQGDYCALICQVGL